ncbi:MAG TPA: hypothetical protein VG889_01695 [Rhizomicrobium sp.]|nr:hypothetical protein [Rhizomicrobium sp.]
MADDEKEQPTATARFSVDLSGRCTSSNPRDAMHDDPYAAAFIVKTIMEAAGLVQGYSYWTFGDIFEENYFPSVPFQGGFGLMNIHGVPKPAYRAFQLLHSLGGELLPVKGSHATVDAWAVRGGDKLTLLMTNFALPRHPVGHEAACLLNLSDDDADITITIFLRIASLRGHTRSSCLRGAPSICASTI